MIDVYYATNRRVLAEGETPKFGMRFNVNGPQELRFGSAKVRKVGEAYELESTILEKESKAAKPKGRPPSGRIFEALRASMADKRLDVICYIHGYASDIKTALERAAEIKDKYKVKGRDAEVFVFSWPADGRMMPWLSYFSDRDDARASGVAMARAFLKLRDYLRELGRDRQCRQSLHLVAHSMGNYALRWAFQGIRGELKNQVPRVFDNVFLMAADEDDDAFEHDHKLRLLPEMARAVHVYFSPDDRALIISDKTKNNPDRLGSLGPRVREGLPRKLFLVDCRHVDVSKDDFTNHQYYRLHPKVVRDVCMVLAGRPPEDMTETRSYIQEDRSWRIDAGPGSATPAGRAGIAEDDTRGC